jgi:hypothetical protein
VDGAAKNVKAGLVFGPIGREPEETFLKPLINAFEGENEAQCAGKILLDTRASRFSGGAEQEFLAEGESGRGGDGFLGHDVPLFRNLFLHQLAEVVHLAIKRMHTSKRFHLPLKRWNCSLLLIRRKHERTQD